MLLEHVQNAVFRVCGSQPPMRWTETGNGRQLATMEDFKAISGWQGGADGSFQSENEGGNRCRIAFLPFVAEKDLSLYLSLSLSPLSPI